MPVHCTEVAVGALDVLFIVGKLVVDGRSNDC
jgi:hypothetical protein